MGIHDFIAHYQILSLLEAILSFRRRILADCLQLEERQGHTLWNHRNPAGAVKPLFIYFSPLDIFASMSQAQFEPVRQRHVASREANRFTK